MKLEIRKETKPNGDIFYHVYGDDKHLTGYWAGNPVSGEKGRGEEKALADAEYYYNILKGANPYLTIVEIIKSEEL